VDCRSPPRARWGLAPEWREAYAACLDARYRAVMSGRSSLARRLALTAAIAAAMTGALLGLAGAVFATFVGHPPSPLTLALIVAAVALASALAAIVVLARAPRVRRAVGLEPRPPGRP